MQKTAKRDIEAKQASSDLYDRPRDPYAPRRQQRRDRAPCLPDAAASSGSRPSPSPRRTTSARSTPAPPTPPSRSRATSIRAEHLRAAAESGADAIHPGYGFLAENAGVRGGGDRGGARLDRPAGGSAAPRRRQAPRQGVGLGGRSSGAPLRGAGRDRLSAPRQSGRRRRRPRHARRSHRGRARRGDSPPRGGRRRPAFGDGTVFYERYVERPRHVEIQLLADTHGTVLALGERDCSVQRRHQKVLEEAPSPAVGPELRAALGAAAVDFARAIGYVGAGTAEFMLDGRDFYFLELNGRIQVEHPVTELVTGIDLVREQIRVARTASRSHLATVCYKVTRSRCGSTRRTRARSCRRAGRSRTLRLPRGVRVDAGVEDGDEIGISYDPMIAKLIAHGPTREEAFARLADALDETEVAGVTTNLPFLRWLVRHPVLRAGEATTAFLTEHPPLSEPPLRLPEGPWRGGWRLNLPAAPPTAAPDVDVAGHAHAGAGGGSALSAPMPGTVLRVHVTPGERVEARQHLLVLEAMKMETPLAAPYDATVKAVHVEEGDRVAGGALLVELESD